MKKLLFLTSLAFVFSACVADKNDRDIIKANAINLTLQTALNPALKEEQTKCVSEKNAMSCLNIANTLLQGTSNAQNIQTASFYYNLACSLGLSAGCDGFNKINK